MITEFLLLLSHRNHLNDVLSSICYFFVSSHKRLASRKRVWTLVLPSYCTPDLRHRNIVKCRFKLNPWFVYICGSIDFLFYLIESVSQLLGLRINLIYTDGALVYFNFWDKDGLLVWHHTNAIKLCNSKQILLPLHGFHLLEFLRVVSVVSIVIGDRTLALYG